MTITPRPLAAFYLAALLSATAAGEVKRADVPANKLFELRPAQPSAILVQQPLDLDYRMYELADGGQVFVFHSGRLGRIVLTLFHNGDPYPVVTQHVIEVRGPEPQPDPQPDPEPLTGFAREVQRRASQAELGQQAKRLAINFDVVASMAAGGGFANVQQAMAKVAEYNNRQWPRAAAPFKAWLEQQLPQRIRNLEDLAEVFREIAKGLAAA